jgi:hypothetical protein
LIKKAFAAVGKVRRRVSEVASTRTIPLTFNADRRGWSYFMVGGNSIGTLEIDAISPFLASLLVVQSGP